MSPVLFPTDRAIDEAAAHLREGRLVALPTETVYGLAGDATNGEAVAAIYALKRRPSFNPLIVHVPGIIQARQVAAVGDAAAALAAAFWPGPLTLVLPLARGAPVAALALAGLDTVAVRAPAHPTARAVLDALDRPLVAPSANRSGRISPTTAAHVEEEFGDAIPVLDGGACAVGVESTIIGLASGAGPVLLRPGAIAPEAVAEVLGKAVTAPSRSVVAAPGMLTSHYAPAAKVRLRASGPREGEVLLGFGGTPGATLDLSPSGDLHEAAANLFSFLRRLDAEAIAAGGRIAVAPVPDTGLGVAINDRLRRAAAPRPGPRTLFGMRRRNRRRRGD